MDRRRKCMQTLLNEVNWQQDYLTLYGKRIAVPRLQAWFCDEHMSYDYSGLTMHSEYWTDTLKALKQEVELFTNIHFNSVLANLYRDGQDSVAWHSDDEPELGSTPIIAALSFGDTRNFQLKHKRLNEKLNIDLTAGSLLVMSGNTQKYWSHCVPKTKRVKSPRISLTFRRINLD